MQSELTFRPTLHHGLNIDFVFTNLHLELQSEPSCHVTFACCLNFYFYCTVLSHFSTDVPLQLNEWCHVIVHVKIQRAHLTEKLVELQENAVLEITSSTWRHRECAADNREKGSAVIATSLPRLKDPLRQQRQQQRRRQRQRRVWAPGWAGAGRWGDEREGTQSRGRKEETRRGSTQHNTTWLKKACAQLRPEGAPAAFFET